MSRGTVNIPLDEWNQLQANAERRKAELAEAHRRARDAEAGSGDERVRALRDIIDVALPVVQFAVGNLPPESVRGWPHVELQQLAERLRTMPGHDAEHETISAEFTTFANECLRLAAHRAVRDVTAEQAATSDVEPLELELSTTVTLSDGDEPLPPSDSSDS